MEELGLFELGTLAAHCVHVDDKDMEILRKHHVRIASNPQSNLKLASGIAPIGQMLQKALSSVLERMGHQATIIWICLKRYV